MQKPRRIRNSRKTVRLFYSLSVSREDRENLDRKDLERQSPRSRGLCVFDAMPRDYDDIADGKKRGKNSLRGSISQLHISCITSFGSRAESSAGEIMSGEDTRTFT